MWIGRDNVDKNRGYENNRWGVPKTFWLVLYTALTLTYLTGRSRASQTIVSVVRLTFKYLFLIKVYYIKLYKLYPHYLNKLYCPSYFSIIIL